MSQPVDALVPESISRALVIKLRHHGDVLLASPVLSSLKAAAPQAEIDALVYDDTAPMLSLHPALSRLHRIDRGWKKAGVMTQLREEWRLLRTLRARRYDLVIHLTEHPRGAWLSRVLKPRWAVGPSKKSGGARWQKSFTHLYPGAMRGRHTVDSNLDALRRLGISPERRALTLVPGAEACERVAGLLAERGVGGVGGDFIHLHPASRWLFKCWPAAHNAELARALAARLPVVITAAPVAEEMNLVRDIVAQAGVPLVDLSGQLSLKELAALTARARLFIGVDSAPMHIAAAMGTPTVALFGPSGEAHWGPWGVRHEVVASERHACRPCGADGCGGSKISECLTTLPVARVLDAALRLLA